MSYLGILLLLNLLILIHEAGSCVPRPMAR